MKYYSEIIKNLKAVNLNYINASISRILSSQFHFSQLILELYSSQQDFSLYFSLFLPILNYYIPTFKPCFFT